MQVDAAEVIETFETAAEENRLSSFRQGQTITLPNSGEVWMTGDIHDHRRNFDKLCSHLESADKSAHRSWRARRGCGCRQPS